MKIKFNKTIISFLGIKVFGVHPKNVFNYRYRFFVENIDSNSIILDVACGVGLISYKVSFKAKKVIGIDRDSFNIKLCKTRFSRENITYIRADILKFDFNDLKFRTNFNVVILSHILEHIKDVPKFIKRINAETLFICVPSQENWESQLLKFLKLPYKKDFSHYREYTRKMLVSELREAGYHPELIGFNSEGEIICKASKER